MRVNKDKGEPLTPVLEECVTSILSQVKLLRQISAEFSSFASRPTPHPAPTSLAELIPSVFEPYITGLDRPHRDRRRRARRRCRWWSSIACCSRARITNIDGERAARHAGRRHADDQGRSRTVDRQAVGRRHRHRHGSGSAAPHLRAVLLDQGDGHRAGSDDREAECGAERRADSRGIVAGQRNDGDDRAADR